MYAVAAAATERKRTQDQQRQQALEARYTDPEITIIFKLIFQNFKKGRPATDVIKDRALLDSLGVKVPDKYWTRRSIKEMLLAINAVLEEDMSAALRAAVALAISMDEATAVDCMAFLSTHMYYVDEKTWRRVHVFIELTHIVGSPNAANLMELVKKLTQQTAGLEAKHLARIVSVGTDGAAVMTGEHSGLAQRIQQEIAPYSLGFHCAAHRTQLCACCGAAVQGLYVPGGQLRLPEGPQVLARQEAASHRRGQEAQDCAEAGARGEVAS